MQQFSMVHSDVKDRLDQKFQFYGEEFSIEDIRFPSFIKVQSRGFYCLFVFSLFVLSFVFFYVFVLGFILFFLSFYSVVFVSHNG
jgi:hypothetical protein